MKIKVARDNEGTEQEWEVPYPSSIQVGVDGSLHLRTFKGMVIYASGTWRSVWEVDYVPDKGK